MKILWVGHHYLGLFEYCEVEASGSRAQAGSKTIRQTDRQTGTLTVRQTHRQVDRQTYSRVRAHTHTPRAYAHTRVKAMRLKERFKCTCMYGSACSHLQPPLTSPVEVIAANASVCLPPTTTSILILSLHVSAVSCSSILCREKEETCPWEKEERRYVSVCVGMCGLAPRSRGREQVRLYGESCCKHMKPQHCPIASFPQNV